MLFSETSGQRQKSLLAEAIERYIAEINEPVEDGPVRTFFKHHVCVPMRHSPCRY